MSRSQLESALHLLADDGTGSSAGPDLAGRALTRARQRNRRQGLLAAVSTAAVAALIAVGVSTVADRQSTDRRSPTAASSAQTTHASSTSGFAGPRTNLLLVGSDGATNRIGVRPDTLILASIDTRTGATTMFGFPRGLPRVPFPPGTPQAELFPNGYSCFTDGVQECLLNSIWTWAEKDGSRYYPGDPNPGLTATTQAIEQISGLQVDNTAVVNLAAMQDLVDAVGGVEVTVPERLPIGGDARSRQATGGWIEQGRQHLNGYQALWFARSRWSTDDDDRMARQQCLVTALAEQVDTRKLITAYPRVANSLRSGLSTSISAADLPKWAELVARIRGTKIQMVEVGDRRAFDPDYPKIRRQIRQAIDGRQTGVGSGTGASSPRPC